MDPGSAGEVARSFSLQAERSRKRIPWTYSTGNLVAPNESESAAHRALESPRSRHGPSSTRPFHWPYRTRPSAAVSTGVAFANATSPGATARTFSYVKV